MPIHIPWQCCNVDCQYSVINISIFYTVLLICGLWFFYAMLYECKHVSVFFCFFFILLFFSRIMGLYVSVVLVIGKFVRGFFSEISHSIMFEELPCVDRILKLCTDIFLVSTHCLHYDTHTDNVHIFTLYLLDRTLHTDTDRAFVLCLLILHVF